MGDTKLQARTINDSELYDNWLKIAISDLNDLNSTIKTTILDISNFKEKNPGINNHMIQMLEKMVPLLQEKYENHLKLLFQISKEPNIPHNVNLMNLAINQYR
jgi:hypothetical protein